MAYMPKLFKICLVFTLCYDLAISQQQDVHQADRRKRASNDESYMCFDVTCDGADCLYNTIVQAGTDVKTCNTESTHGCFIEKSITLGVIQTQAGCGHCAGMHTTTRTTELGIWKRRKRSADNKQCCFYELCNHEGPCGSVECSAGIRHTMSGFLLFLGVLFITFL